MARERAKSDAEVRKLTAIGEHWVDDNLFLQIHENGAKSWLFRYTRDGKSRRMGLGALKDVSVRQARDKADELRPAVRRGEDPVADRRAERQAKKTRRAEQAGVPTFADCVREYLAAHEASWSNPKHREQWESTLRSYAGPVIGAKRVDEVTRGDVLAVLQPIWNTKIETAKRLRGRIEKVLDWAKVEGHRAGENPARWKGNLEFSLAKPSSIQTIVHQPAVAYSELPALMAELQKRNGEAAKSLQFTILTAARTGEVIGAPWEEFDLAEKLWSIPAKRTKMKREHRVPLSEPALDILRGQVQDGFVFPGSRAGRAMSNMAMLKTLRSVTGDSIVTVHGTARSSFRDWAAEQTTFPAEVVEAALAHSVANKVIAAYLRTDHLERRRELMEEWAAFLCGEHRPTQEIRESGDG